MGSWSLLSINCKFLLLMRGIWTIGRLPDIVVGLSVSMWRLSRFYREIKLFTDSFDTSNKAWNIKGHENLRYTHSRFLADEKRFLLSIFTIDHPKNHMISKTYHHRLRYRSNCWVWQVCNRNSVKFGLIWKHITISNKVWIISIILKFSDI